MYPKGDSNNINVYVNGTLLKLDQPALMKNGRTLVPFRAVLEALGATVSWDEEKQAVHAEKDGIDIELPLQSTTAKKNGQTVQLDVPAEQINYRTMVPLRFMSEALGASLGWAGKTNSVFISTYEDDEIAPMARYLIDMNSDIRDSISLQQTLNAMYKNFLDQKVTLAEFTTAYEQKLVDLKATIDKIQALPVPNDPLSKRIAEGNIKILQKTLDMLTKRGEFFSEKNEDVLDSKMKEVLTLIEELMGDNEAYQQEVNSILKISK
ncbi:MAG: copper amine oxidase N-terminal domain-containing protein, partial [Tumebacillaceae bacterium]